MPRPGQRFCVFRRRGRPGWSWERIDAIGHIREGGEGLPNVDTAMAAIAQIHIIAPVFIADVPRQKPKPRSRANGH